MATMYGEVFPLMMHVVNLGRIRIDASLPIPQHRSILPTCFPQLIADLQILVGHVIPLVVWLQPRPPEVAARTFQVRGDDIQGDASPGQLVQGRDSAGNGIRSEEE